MVKVPKAEAVEIITVERTLRKPRKSYASHFQNLYPEVKERLCPGQSVLKQWQVRRVFSVIAELWRGLTDEEKASYRQVSNTRARNRQQRSGGHEGFAVGEVNRQQRSGGDEGSAVPQVSSCDLAVLCFVFICLFRASILYAPSLILAFGGRTARQFVKFYGSKVTRSSV